jgi:ATP-dependent exoDNAse (exonuclease V) beta subunit
MALTLCSAGAGSGKTFRLCEVIAGRVLDGLDPAKILATTYTRKAAAELRDRIEAKLLAATDIEAAKRADLVQRLDLAAMGTVHSVAQRLIVQHALELGLSPDIEVLDADAQKRHLYRMLEEAHGQESTELDDLMTAFSVAKPDEHLLNLLESKRTNTLSDEAFRSGLVDDLELWIATLAQGAPIQRPNGLAHLQSVGRDVLEVLNECVRLKNASGTKKAAEKLAQVIDARQPVWASFLTGDIYGGGARDGGKDAAAVLLATLQESLRWTGLHDDMRRLVALTADRVCRLGESWEAYKRARGLFDFADLEVWLLRLLQDPHLAPRVASRFDLVVVDEFQDTNPIQLEIFLRLGALVRDSWWVGDDKQAIYGFRGADASLVRAVWAHSPQAIHEKLPKNYRSQAGLVRFVNQIFADPLPGCALVPHRPAAEADLERWALRGSTIAAAMAALAAGVRELTAEGSYRPSQVAVLARTNAGAEAIAEALRAAGVPRKLALPGLLDAREVAAAIAGLQLVIEPGDTLAAATLLYLLRPADSASPTWLQERLTQLATDGTQPWSDPVLEPVRKLAEAGLSPAAAVESVIATLDQSTRAATWGDPIVRLARLDALLDLARKYEERARQDGTGATLAGLTLTLSKLASDEKDKEPVAADADAVIVSTVHGAKGLEWPVVVLAELHKTYDPLIGKPVVTGGDVAGGRPLEGRRMRWWPDPFGGKLGTDVLFLQTQAGKATQQAEADSHLRLMYVAMTRARDKLVFAIRSGKDADADRAALACVPEFTRFIPDTEQPGEAAIPELETTLLIRAPEPAEETVVATTIASTRWWQPVAQDGTPAPERVRSPSGEKPKDKDGIRVEVEPLPGPLLFAVGAQEHTDDDNRADYGDAVHAYLATLPASAGLDLAVRTAVAVDCLVAHGMEQHATPGQLVTAGERFETWRTQKYPGAVLHTEVPVTGPRQDGGLWHGTIDALLELPDGALVVIDHKSTPVGSAGGQVAVARRYAMQLQAYEQALGGLGRRVVATWIHFPIGGACARVMNPSPPPNPAASAIAPAKPLSSSQSTPA